MKEETPSEVPAKTGPVLLKAYSLLKAYAAGTGSMVCVHDASFRPIPEMLEDIKIEKNICQFCAKYRSPDTPCSEMHISAMKKAFRHSGSYSYTCELGFAFWTSPVYSDGTFIGALVGTGYRASDEEEAGKLFRKYNSGEISKNEFNKKIKHFPRADEEKIGALAELLHICAESLSAGKGDRHETLRRRAEQQADLSARIKWLKDRHPSIVPTYPIDTERKLLEATRRGENGTVKKFLNEILALVLFANPNDMKYLQCRAIELVVLLSRADLNSGSTDKALFETNSACIRHIQESKTIEELADVLYLSAERITEQISSFRGIRHASALRKAERYIMENYTRKISLKEIAGASDLSAPYFSTIFKEEMGENLSSYINRLRVEKAGHMLLETSLSLSKIASSCGFEDQSWFSKIFKSYMGSSPGKFREQGHSIEEISEDNFSEEASRQIKK
jgi:AraC-like DNA-binding protein/ligand-binding sensor protein